MAALGLASLGVFVGCVIGFGLRHLTDWSRLARILTTVLAAALGGFPISLIGRFGGADLGSAVWLYPVGLVVGVAWVNARTALQNLQSSEGRVRNLAILHIVGLVLLTVLTFAVLFSPGVRSLLP